MVYDYIYKGYAMKKYSMPINGRKVDMLVENMLRYNQLTNIINYERQGNNLVYDIEGLKHFSETLNQKMSYDDIKEIILTISQVAFSLDNLMIDEKNINLDINHIYMDDKNQLKLLILPYESNFSFKDLFIKILSQSTFILNEEAVNVLAVLNYLNTDNYTIKGLGNYLENKLEKAEHNKSIETENKTIETNDISNSMLKDDTKEYLDSISGHQIKKENSKRNLFEELKKKFSKKDYRSRSLNIDFSIPKKK